MYKLLLLTILSINSFAQSFFVYDYNANGEISLIERDFSSFMVGSETVNKHFKVVNSTDDEAIDLLDNSLDEYTRRQGATVFYHLNIAMNSLNSVFDLSHLQNRGTLTARINMDRMFSDSTKYLDIEEGVYNNSVTIPASTIRKDNNTDSWPIEIWFRPKKNIEVDNIFNYSLQKINSSSKQSDLIKSLGNNVLRSLVIEGATRESFAATNFNFHAEQIFITYLFSTTVPYIAEKVSHPIKEEFYLDTANIPEIIYHEFAHVLLSDYVAVNRNTQVGEAYANYIASMIKGGHEIGLDSNGHASNAGGHNGEFNFTYRRDFEQFGNEHNGFAYSLLIAIKNMIISHYDNKELGEKIANEIIYESRKYIKFSKSLTHIKSLMRGIDRSIVKSSAQNKRLLRMELPRIGHKFGL